MGMDLNIRNPGVSFILRCFARVAHTCNCVDLVRQSGCLASRSPSPNLAHWMAVAGLARTAEERMANSAGTSLDKIQCSTKTAKHGD